MFLLAHLFFVANSPLNMMFIFTLSCFSTASRSIATFPASSKNRRGSIRVYHHTSIYDSRTRRRSLAKQEICHSHTRHSRTRHHRSLCSQIFIASNNIMFQIMLHLHHILNVRTMVNHTFRIILIAIDSVIFD